MTIEIKFDVNEKIIRDRVKQWEVAWNLGSEPFSMKRFGDLYVRDESLLAYDLTSPQTPSILRGYQQYVKTWEPFMQGFSPWNIKINDDLRIHAGDRVSVATFTWKIWGRAKIDGESISGELHATVVFENRNGKWQIVHEHISTLVRDTVAESIQK
ncbi:MAG: YybH family protein [Xenococcaceae cyanobacterium]